MIIPSEYTFELNCIGEITGKPYTGEFTYKFATIAISQKIIQEVLKLDREYTAINKELDPEVSATNELIATLKHCMISCPQWFKDVNYGKDLEDATPLYLIIDELKKFKEIREEALKG